MKPTTLSEYYSSQGQALPSVSARQSQAAQAGIQNYSGTAAQNTQLLGYLQNQGSNTATPVIPAQNVGSGTQPVPLPNQPQSQEQSNVYASASSYLANLPKTGVAGLDQISQAMIDIPGQLAQQYDIANKQNLASQTENALNAFNEEYRVKAEQLRVDNTRTAASKQTSIEELERNRAFKAGSLAIEAAFRAKDFQGAKELMNQQAALVLEPLKMRYKFFEDMYNRTEDQKFQRAMKAEDRAYQAKRDDLNMLNDYKMQLLKDGKIDAKGLGSIQSWDELANYTGISKTDTAIQSYALQNKNDPRSVISYIFEKTGAKKDEGISSAAAVVAAAQDLATGRQDGRFKGAGGFLFRTRTRGAEPTANRSAIEAINLRVGQWASGASLTEQQQKQVDKMTPRVGDSDRQIRNKVNALTNFMMSDISGKLSTQGVNIDPASVDFWSKNKGTVSTETTTDIASKIGQAYANGYGDVQIVQALKVSNPELSEQIDTALQNFTPEEVVAFLMENKQ